VPGIFKVAVVDLVALANQSLKLTENTACFSPREKKYLGKWRHVPRV
jgi:hypothetical protein